MNFDQLEPLLRAAFAGREPRTLEVPGFRRASVLIPVLRRESDATLLFMRRSRGGDMHSGQIAFPGGRVEVGESLEQAALREAFEEVALPPDSVELVGRLDDFPSVSSYMVSPFIGIVETPPAEFVLEEREVAAVFEASVARALDDALRRTEEWDESRLPPESPREKLLQAHLELGHLKPGARSYPAYFFDITPDGDPVWGLTARILEDFLRPLRAAR